MENQNAVHSLFERAGDYLETRVELYKLQAVKKSSQLISSLVSRLIVLLIGVLFITMLSIAVALWIGSSLGSLCYGFFAVAGFYLLAGVIVFIFRASLLRGPVINSLIKKMMN